MVPLVGVGAETLVAGCVYATAALLHSFQRCCGNFWHVFEDLLADSGTAGDGVVEDHGWSVLPYRDGAVEVVSVDLEELGGCFDEGVERTTPWFEVVVAA